MKRSLQSVGIPAGPLFTVGAVALIAATYGLARLGYGLFLPVFSTAFTLTPLTGGLLASGTSVLYCAAAALGFRYAPERPRRVVLLAGMSAALGSAGIAVAPDTGLFVGAVLLAGMGAGFASPGLVELVQRNVRVAEQDRIQSAVNSGTGFGVIAAGILALAVGQLSWRLAWWLIALIALTSMVAVLRADSSRDRPGPAAETAPDRAARPRGGKGGLRHPAAAAFVFGIGCAAVWVHGRALLEERGGLATGESAAAWIALGFGGAAAVFTAPWLARHAIRVTWPATVIAAAFATALFALAPQNLVAGFAAAALFGLSYTAATSVLILWAAQVSPSSAAGTSVLFTSLVLGQSAGSAVTSALIQPVGYATAFLLAAGACASSVLGRRPQA